MTKVTTIIVTVAALLVGIAAVYYLASTAGLYQADKETHESVTQMSKAEYIELALRNNTTEDESLIRCFYSEYIDRHGVKRALKFDLQAQGGDFELTQEQAQLADSCL